MIEFRQLRKNFGDREVLSGIDLQVQEGEILFLIGTSGTGKSVTLKLLVGLLRATSGEIWLNGENITDLSEEEYFRIRRQCGMVFQYPALFDSLNLFDNVAYGLRRNFQLTEEEIGKKVHESLRRVHVHADLKLFPQDLSYGTQKRVSLARTICIQPQILLFDEPTTGLDPITTNAVSRLIFDLSRELKTTSIVVSHDMKCAVEIADRIAVLDSGKIVAQGTPKEMMQNTHPLVRDFMQEVHHA